MIYNKAWTKDVVRSFRDAAQDALRSGFARPSIVWDGEKFVAEDARVFVAVNPEEIEMGLIQDVFGEGRPSRYTLRDARNALEETWPMGPDVTWG